MLHMDLAHALVAIREKVCPARPTAGRASRGLLFRLRLELHKGGVSERAALAVLVGGNSFVFVARGNLRPGPAAWDFAGAHVSQWRAALDAALTALHFELADKVNARLGPDKAVAPAAMDHLHRFADQADPWEEVVVVTRQNPADPHGHALKVERVLPY